MNKSFSEFFQRKKILITGHSGFKGAWLYLFLEKLGAELYGFSQAAKSKDDLSVITSICESENSILGNIGDYNQIADFIEKIKPDIIFHLAAQSLVLKSYEQPFETFNTNVLGTLNLLEAVKRLNLPTIIINITTDKCYVNNNSGKPFVESDSLGGNDPYSASKAMVEILSNSYYQSFFQKSGQENQRQALIKLTTVRAGNVIGGGDWNENRLIPDFVKAIKYNQKISLRNPDSIRPWQHVLEPIYAYCLLAYKLSLDDGESYCSAWNIGPNQESCISVKEVANLFLSSWGKEISTEESFTKAEKQEARLLMLDSSKAKTLLQWEPKFSVSQAINATAQWYKNYLEKPNQIKEFTYEQLQYFLDLI
jgi:CDP-glucose 4,6-dehydratase